MKITISGIQSSGKTTLIKNLQKLPEFKNWHFEFENIRNIKDLGLPINESTTDESQMLIEAKHLENAYMPWENSILDRCSLDSLCYAIHLEKQGQISYDVLSFCVEVFENTIGKYDKIFYIVPEIKPIEDGTRSIKGSFYNEMHDIFIKQIQEYDLLDKVIFVRGSIETRTQLVKDMVFGWE